MRFGEKNSCLESVILGEGSGYGALLTDPGSLSLNCPINTTAAPNFKIPGWLGGKVEPREAMAIFSLF